MFQRFFVLTGVLGCLLISGCVTTSDTATSTSKPQSAGNGSVQIKDLGGKLRVEIDGELFTEYYYKDVPRPFMYPLIGPKGLPVTRNWPMTSPAGEEHDHPHHRSLWFAHGDINGVDFWSETPKAGKTVHDKFLEVKTAQDTGVIRSRNNWVGPDGKIVCTDERTIRFFNVPDTRFIDFEITIKASNGDLIFGDTKEGSMALRVAETMRVKGNPSKGHIVNANGAVDDATWGKRAPWCDYQGKVNGEWVGIAMFDHPSNPRWPTWWHVRDYGLFAANPFGVHDFEKQPAGTGDMAVPAGQSVTFRYRIYIHLGDEKAAEVQERYMEYLGLLPQK